MVSFQASTLSFEAKLQNPGKDRTPELPKREIGMFSSGRKKTIKRCLQGTEMWTIFLQRLSQIHKPGRVAACYRVESKLVFTE